GRVFQVSLISAAAGLAAGWAFAVTNGSGSIQPRSVESPGFASKAGSPRPGFGLDVHCVDGNLEERPVGSTLLFLADVQVPQGFLHAYAENTATHERIWYFSRASEAPFLGPPNQRERIVERAIRIGKEHAPGLYQITLLLAGAPLEPNQVAAPPAEA